MSNRTPNNGVQRRLLAPRQAAAYLGISLATLLHIERCGHIVPYRTPGGHRRYSREMLDEYLEKSRGFLRDRKESGHGGDA